MGVSVEGFARGKHRILTCTVAGHRGAFVRCVVCECMVCLDASVPIRCERLAKDERKVLVAGTVILPTQDSATRLFAHANPIGGSKCDSQHFDL